MWKLQSEKGLPDGISANNIVRTYKNSTTGSECVQTKCYTDKENNIWFEFNDLISLPFARSFAANKVTSLFALGITPEDANQFFTKHKATLRSKDDGEKYERAYGELIEFENKFKSATDPVKQMSSLVCVYYTINDEPIDSFSGDIQLKKMALLEADPQMHSFFFESANNTHRKITEFLQSNYPNCFSGSKLNGHELSFTARVQKVANNDRDMQLMLRAIANGVPSERDRLFEYSIGELYQELSLFLQENEIRKKELEDMKKK